MKKLFTQWRAVFLALACTCVTLPSLAQTDSLLLSEAPDRAAKALAAANKEGTLTLYTAFRPQDLPIVLAPFEKKYGIKVNAWRSGSNNVTQRVLREAGSKNAAVDVVMMPAAEMVALYREKILQPATSPHLKELIPNSVPSHKHWATVFMNVTVQTYNTNLIKRADLPKTYSDLLDPKWKGSLGVEAKADEWFSKVVRSMGEEQGLRLFKDVVARNGVSTRLGVSLLHNLVIAGEVPLALTVYIDIPEKDKRAGKPVDWFALEPVVAQGFNMGISAKALHPNAALLFYEYMLSPETQKLLASLHYFPASTKATSPYPNLKLDVIDPDYSVDNFAKWNKLFEDTMTKQAR